VEVKLITDAKMARSRLHLITGDWVLSALVSNKFVEEQKISVGSQLYAQLGALELII